MQQTKEVSSTTADGKITIRTNRGLDVFGPFHIKERRTELKKWGLMATCMYSRAVHIEVLEDMSTDNMIQALRCVIAICGPIQTITSDKGTNFVGASNELEKEWNTSNLRNYLLTNRIEWKFNAPLASNQGGATERMIRSARALLSALALKYKGHMDTKTLRTALYETANIINSRPLTATSVNCELARRKSYHAKPFTEHEEQCGSTSACKFPRKKCLWEPALKSYPSYCPGFLASLEVGVSKVD